MQKNHPDCSRVALFLGSGSYVKPNPTVPDQFADSTIHSDKNLSNINLHAWLLDSQLSKSKASLRQWHHELRLLEESQLDQSMKRSGPFLQNGAKVGGLQCTTY